MAESCRFAFAVHILAVLAHHPGRGVTSDSLARSVNTNPVVVRRIVSTLRQAGLVCCSKGAGGGATLCRQPETIRLDEVYRAIEAPQTLTARRHRPNLGCPVARKIKIMLEEVYASAQQPMEASLAQRTLADALEERETTPVSAVSPALTSRSRKTV